MDLAWLAGLGVLLLVAALSVLGIDTVRRRHEHQAFPFPDEKTNRLDEHEAQSLANTPPASHPVPVTRPQRPALPISRPRLRLRGVRWPVRKLRNINPRPILKTAGSTWLVPVVVCCSLLLAGTGVVVLAELATRAEPASPPGSIVAGVCKFV